MSGDDMVGLFSNAKSIWRHCVDLWQICWCGQGTRRCDWEHYLDKHVVKNEILLRRIKGSILMCWGVTWGVGKRQQGNWQGKWDIGLGEREQVVSWNMNGNKRRTWQEEWMKHQDRLKLTRKVRGLWKDESRVRRMWMDETRTLLCTCEQFVFPLFWWNLYVCVCICMN
jgi:hypothetical protein